MIRVHNAIDACRHPEMEPQYRDLDLIRYVMLHRLDPDHEKIQVKDHPKDLAEWFREEMKWSFPYPIFIDGKGKVYQTRHLTEVSPHAHLKNEVALGVAVSGNFTHQYPTAQQVESVRWVTRELCLLLGLHWSAIVGHDEVPGASSDPDKVCPGHMLDPENVRRVVRGDLRADARYTLQNAGMVLEV